MLRSIRKLFYNMSWLIIWLPLLPVGLIALIYHGDSQPLLMALAAGLAGIFLQFRRNVLLGFCLTVLALALTTTIYMLARSSNIWQIPPSGISLLSLLTGESFAGQPDSSRSQGMTFARINMEGNGGVTVEGGAKLVAGEPGWGWYVYHPDFQLQLLTENDGRYLHIQPPSVHAPQRYIARQVSFIEPLSGRTFRVRGVLRSPYEFNGQGCQGIRLQMLQTADGPARGSCSDIALTSYWSTYELVWTAPSDTLSNKLRVSLHNIDVPSYDVRSFLLEELINDVWQVVAPLEPNGVTVYAQDRRTGELLGIPASFIPKEAESRYTLELPPGELTDIESITLVTQVEAGVKVELSAPEILRHGDESTWAPERISRLSLWFPHANLAAHSIAVWGAVAVALLPVPYGVLALFVTLAVIVATGSRAAWLASLVLAYFLVWKSDLKMAYRLGMTITLSALLLGLYLSGASGLRIFQADELNGVSRKHIWEVAINGMRDAPWVGHGSHSFNQVWSEQGGSTAQPVPQHTHNMWLQFGFGYGLPGLLAVLWSSMVLLVMSWRWGRLNGLALALTVLTLNFFDFTLFYAGVLYPLIAGLNSLRMSRS